LCPRSGEWREKEKEEGWIAADPLTWPASALSKWQFVFHLGTISRVAALYHQRRSPGRPAGFAESPRRFDGAKNAGLENDGRRTVPRLS